jgi:hypothetical protein
MSKETLHFKVGLSTNSSSKLPEFTLGVNGTTYFKGTLSSGGSVTDYFEFDAEIEEGDGLFEICLLNKQETDTVKGDNGEILEDMLLNVDSIEIDDISLGFLLWTHSKYFPNYPKSYIEYNKASGAELPESVLNCVNMGWNGSWQIPFTSPFFVWLLENL